MRAGGEHSARLSRFTKLLDRIRAPSGIRVATLPPRKLKYGYVYSWLRAGLSYKDIDRQGLLESFA